jgi:hypothetical protein
MEPIAIAVSVQPVADLPLNRGVLAFDRLHGPASDCGRFHGLYALRMAVNPDSCTTAPPRRTRVLRIVSAP